MTHEPGGKVIAARGVTLALIVTFDKRREVETAQTTTGASEVLVKVAPLAQVSCGHQKAIASPEDIRVRSRAGCRGLSAAMDYRQARIFFGADLTPTHSALADGLIAARALDNTQVGEPK